MPSLGADMESGTLVDWRVQPGDTVKRGDVVALVETEKGVIEVEIFESGVVESLVVKPGQKVPVGATLATIRTDGRPAETRLPLGAASTEQKTEAPPASAPVPASPPPKSLRPRVSPLARKRAEELGVDIATATGTGEEGPITAQDIERAAEQAKAPAAAVAPVTAKGLDLNAMRRVIAAAMARSKREIPHYYLNSTIDMRCALDWLAAENAKRPVTKRLLYSALLIRAVALAIREVPEVNGFCIEGTFKPGDGIHVGVAISLRQGGLINPAIHDVDKKPLDEVMENMLDLVNRARSRSSAQLGDLRWNHHRDESRRPRSRERLRRHLSAPGRAGWFR